MSVTLEPSDAQFADMMKIKRFADKVLEAKGKELARLEHEALMKEAGGLMTNFYALPLREAARLSGWDVQWIRRNLPIIEAEGQHDKIMFGDLKKAMEDRKNK